MWYVVKQQCLHFCMIIIIIVVVVNPLAAIVVIIITYLITLFYLYIYLFCRHANGYVLIM